MDQLIEFKKYPLTSKVLDRLLQDKTTKRNIKPVVDLNEIKPTQKLKSGYFASYYLYPVYSDKMGESIREVITDLQRFHEIPIMIAEYSLPSAKVVYEEMSGQLLGINEREQAEGLVTIYRTLRQLSILGSCLSEWQDRWGSNILYDS